MKLESKHLAPYLPYELNAVMNIFGDNETRVKIVGLNFEFVELDGIRKTVTEHFEFHCIKPILRPLSDLTKEIEVNGEKFLPIKKLDWEYLDGEQGSMIYCEYGESPKAVVNVLYYIDDYFNLLSWHFDVFGLIPAGLAIDINEIVKEVSND